MTIRLLLPSDRREWLRMRHSLWPDAGEENEREIDAFLSGGQDQAVFVVDRGGGRLGGFLEAGLRPYAEGCDTSPVGYIEGWWVDDDLRRQGVGGALVQAAEAWARDQGLREMASDCTLENAVSYQAHLALGYEETGRVICFRKQVG